MLAIIAVSPRPGTDLSSEAPEVDAMLARAPGSANEALPNARSIITTRRLDDAM